jgi:hypothetical protein
VLSETPIQLKNGNYVLSVVLDGGYLTEVASGPVTGEYSVSGSTITTADTRTAQVMAVYHANPAGNLWADVSDSSMPVAIRGRDVAVVIGANDIKRVQSVTINGNLQSQPVREMHNHFVVGYQRQIPTVEGTITVLDTDVELISLLTVGDPLSADTEFLVEGGCTVSGVSLDIVLYDPCDPETPVKTLFVPTMRIVGDAFVQNVNENAQQTFNWQSETAELLIYSGAR